MIKNFKVKKKEEAIRLDKWLKKNFSSLKQSFIEKNIRKKNILVNKLKKISSYKLIYQDEITILNFDKEKGRKYYDRNQINAQFRKQKFLCATDNTGYDEYYLISGDTMKITDGSMATPSDNAKKGEIKRLFAQNLKSNRHSRVIMNKFISQVA